MTEQPSFTCPVCGAISHHPDDVRYGYCGRCHEYTGKMEAALIKFSDMTVLPPPPGVCEACAVDHEPEQPHNQQSLHYQYWFRLQEARAGREERWPTWADAMAHCSPEIQQQWRAALAERGVQVDP